VLQRVAVHPAKQVHELTPRLWKEKFVENPMSSDLEN
jgi:transposase